MKTRQLQDLLILVALNEVLEHLKATGVELTAQNRNGLIAEAMHKVADRFELRQKAHDCN